jgi:16S rRNA (guanine1207-N2)-methyltransferase
VPMSLLDEVPAALPPEMLTIWREVWPSAELLAASVPTSGAGRVLMLGCAADPLCLVVARRIAPSTCLVADDDAAAGGVLLTLAATAHLTSLQAADPAVLAAASVAGTAPVFDTAIVNTLYQPSKHMTLALIRLAHALLAPGGKLYAAGAKDHGILSIAGEMRRLFGNAETLDMRKGHRVVVSQRAPGAALGLDEWLPSDPQSVERVTVRGQSLAIMPTPLVFAGGRLDPATAMLADAIDVRKGDKVADLGSGAGIAGLAAARLAPRGYIHLLDASYSAVRTAALNADLNGLANVSALAGDALALLRERDIRPTLMVTNPPFHLGQTQTRQVAERFIAGAAERLAPGGRFYLVANRFLPYERDLRARFGEVREVAGDARYKVLLGERASG